MRLCACVLWNKCERALLCFVCLSSCVLCENDQKSLCFCVFFSCVWWSTQTQNQFFTKITMFDFFKVKKPLCKSVLKLFQLILVIKIRFRQKKVQFCVLYFFCFLGFVQVHFLLGVLVENKTQNSFVLLCPGTFLNGVCVVCVLYIFFQSGTDESLG